MFNSRTSVAQWLWVHNPFYVISSLLMLYGVRASYGQIDIGTINCWAMMGVLGAYTLVLSIVGVLIVRWGQVWDDARSILLVLLLLFLAVSVSADDLFVKMESAQGGAILMGCGFGFSIAILLGVLYFARIRLKLVYVAPLVLFLGLFFVMPWWCSPELHPMDSMTLDWTVFLFPQIAAVLMLTLLPAARMGQKSIEDNGTPWPWPVFPWSAFVFIGIAVVLRSYALTMTFSQSGPIWTSPDSRIGIVFDTIWRPYFLVPFAMSVLILILEAGLSSGNRRLVGRALLAAPGVLLLAWPWSPSDAMTTFLSSLTSTLGSPVWLTIWLLIAFHGWATIRRVASAGTGLLASILMFAVIGPKTINSATMTDLNPLPLFIVGMILVTISIRQKNSALTLVASCLVTAGLWVVLPQTSFAASRTATCYFLILAVCLVLSILWNDAFAKQLQTVGAVLLMVSAFMALDGRRTEGLSWQWRIGGVVGLCIICGLCARLTKSRAYWASFVGTIGILGYSTSIEGYRNLTVALGRGAMAAFSWSAGTLIIGLLISAHKARWLPDFAWTSPFGSTLLQTDTQPAAIVAFPDEISPNDSAGTHT